MSSIDGNWSLTLHSPQGDVQATLDLTSDPDPRGTLATGTTAPGDLMDVVIDGETVSWKAQITEPMPLMVDFTATADGDQMVGTASVQSFIKIPFDGSRN